ncbi:hypothetical protein KUTeg_015784 [Tegillarca granosa]|uniref:Uncharacterized protein n=1 Tax=Tegillarca granosa TaxID=220873 RepID=A0ABQ9END1_TEGGR|nr:hypothetical protein KUTeg_015784 [Tegillarca granosa]
MLKEQERLKDILIQQEQKLNKKKDQLHMQQQLQKERLEYFEQNGKFPLKKPDVNINDHHDFLRTNQQEDSVLNGEIERLDFDKPLSEADVCDLASEAEKENIDTTFNVRNKVSTATSPMSKSQFDRPLHSIATSPIRMDQSKAVQHTPPRGIDVATSISYQNAGMRSPKSPSLQEITGDRQGNLPMHANRQRTPKAHLSPSAAVSKKPGDKTMTVVDIVNCLEEYPKFSPSRSNFSPAHHQSIEEDPEVSEQESKILEEIFFLS